MVEKIELTADDVADDWTKLGAWDFSAKTYEAFVDMMDGDMERIGEFVQLPAWHAAPAAIRDGVAEEYPDLVDLFFDLDDFR